MNSEDVTDFHRLPLAMRAVFQDLFLITYAVKPEDLASVLPPIIHPFVRGGRSFISIVVANIRGMRPTVLPEALGTNYYQIVYRAVVCVRGTDGVERPGVFFLRSDGNDAIMNFFGNRLTEFRFHYFRSSAIGLFTRDQNVLISVESADKGGDLVLHLVDQGPAEAQPASEGFSSLEDEKHDLVQLFNAYAYDPHRKVVHDLEIERGEWDMRRLRYEDGFSAFFSEGPCRALTPNPISCIYIKECAYVWKPMVSVPVEKLI